MTNNFFCSKLFSKKYLLLIVLLSLQTLSVFSQITSVSFSRSNLPIIIIETNDQVILDDPKITANMKIINQEGENNYLSDTSYEYNGKIGIEIRGSSSQSFPKSQYGFETRKEDGSNNNVSLLGLPAENDWVLYAPYVDKSLIRNILAYSIYRKLGSYSPRTKLCELVINGEYRGVYVLIEKIKRDKDRVDISKLKAGDIEGDELTGGYIIKIDKTTGNSGSLWYTDKRRIPFQYEYPKYDKITTEQKNYIKNYLDSFEVALSGPDFMDPNIGYRKFIDEESFINFFLINEVAKNVDGYILSTFLYKDKDSKDGKLKIGPIWDFNVAFGNAFYRSGYKNDSLQVTINPSPWWWSRLLQDTTFVNNIKAKWQVVREGALSTDSIKSEIDSLARLLDSAQVRNFKKWDILKLFIWPNHFVGYSYVGEIRYLKDWTTARLKWMDSNMDYITAYNIIEYQLKSFPNPFSDSLMVSYSMPEPGNITIEVYSLDGNRVVKLLDNLERNKGYYIVEWDASNQPNGLYIVKMSVDGRMVSAEKVINAF